jgi:hypothetical protein
MATLSGQVIAITQSHVAVRRDDDTVYTAQIVVDDEGVIRLLSSEDDTRISTVAHP